MKEREGAEPAGDGTGRARADAEPDADVERSHLAVGRDPGAGLRLRPPAEPGETPTFAGPPDVALLLSLQRTAGNAAVVALLEGAGLTVQRGKQRKKAKKKKRNPQGMNYQNYAQKRLKALAKTKKSMAGDIAVIEAKELDKVYNPNLVESAADYPKVPAGAGSKRKLEEHATYWRRLSKKARTTEPLDEFQNRFGDIRYEKEEEEGDPDPEVVVSEVLDRADNREAIEALLTEFGIDEDEDADEALDRLLQGRAQLPPSPKVHLGALTAQGAGTWMRARLTADMNVGSDTSASKKKIPWEDQHLVHRKEVPGGSTIYVLGHLLNENIGGTATAPNLVPLTAAKLGTTGANDANALHLGIVEVIVKGLHQRLASKSDATAPKEVWYEVGATPRSGAPRPGTTAMRQLADDFRKVHQTTLGGRADATVAEVYAVAPSAKLAAALRAVGSKKDADHHPATQVADLLDRNADLWVYEDTHVPLQLVCVVRYPLLGAWVDKTRYVPIVIPDQLDAPFEPGGPLPEAPGAVVTMDDEDDDTGPTGHNQNYRSYLDEMVPLDQQTGPEWDGAEAAATVLDEIYAAAPAHAGYAKLPGGAGQRLAASKEYWRNLKVLVRAQDAEAWKPGASPKVYFGAQTASGSGTWMKSRLTKSMLLGSDTAKSRDEIPWDRDHLKFRKQDGNKALYVLGHLLNANIGGTGTAPNLVPLTAADSGTTGANNANKIHVSTVEGIVKGLVLRMEAGVDDAPTTVNYAVYAIPRTTAEARPQTKPMSDLAAAFEATRKVTLPKVLPPRPGAKGKAPTITVKARDVIDATDAKDRAPMERAVVAVGTTGTQADKIAKRMKDNAALWSYEDVNVPARLECVVSYLQHGSLVGPTTYEVPIDLPDQYDTPYGA